MTQASLELTASHACYGGCVEYYRHQSSVCGTSMRFSVYRPPQAAYRRVPVLYWLSGLTCTEENFMVKAGAQRYASEFEVMLVVPDTSPRGLDLPGEHEDYDFGSGAGFYVNATQSPWVNHYRMYDYVLEELPALVAAHLPADTDRSGVFGHSMGGHGALVVALRNPDRYRSVSAFAPICAPTLCPWGHKAFAGYLGPDQQAWAQYDAHLLVGTTEFHQTLLVDQGTADPFLEEQLRPWDLEASCRERDHPLTLRFQAGYDHSYFFIASFMREHIAHHALALKAA